MPEPSVYECKGILLVSQPSDQLSFYKRKLEERGISYDCIVTLSDIKANLTQKKYRAVLIDFRSRMKSDGESKAWAFDLESYFLSTCVNWDAQNQKITLASAPWLSKTFDEFISIALEAPFRQIRSHDRRLQCFNAIVSFGETFFHTNTVDIGYGGCFIWTPSVIELGSKVSVKLQSVQQNVLEGKVAWIRPWGRENRPCGWGILFEEPLQELPSVPR